MVSSLCLVWQHVKMSDVSLGTPPRYSLVVDEDVKRTNQLNKQNLKLPSVQQAQSLRASVCASLQPSLCWAVDL